MTETVQAMTGTKIPISEEDGALLHEAMSSIVEAQNALGAELERHLNVVETLKGGLDNARSDYRSLVDVLAKKYVKRPGSYDFRPELGAFIER